MALVLWVMYAVGALVTVLSIFYGVKDLAADLVLMGASVLISVIWVVGALVFFVGARNGHGPAEAITFWGYVATGVTLPLAAVYLSFLERTRWGSIAIGAVALTTGVLAFRLPQIWPGMVS